MKECWALAGETRRYPRESDEGMAHPSGGLSYVLACNSAKSESREPVLQHAIYYRLYNRSCFAGRQTCVRHVPQCVARQDCWCAPDGFFSAFYESLSRPGNLSGSHLFRQSSGFHGASLRVVEYRLASEYAWATPPLNGTGRSVRGDCPVRNYWVGNGWKW